MSRPEIAINLKAPGFMFFYYFFGLNALLSAGWYFATRGLTGLQHGSSRAADGGDSAVDYIAGARTNTGDPADSYSRDSLKRFIADIEADGDEDGDGDIEQGAALAKMNQRHPDDPDP